MPQAPAGAYKRFWARSRRTGADVAVYDTEHLENTFDPVARWAIVCETHGTLAYDKSLDHAYTTMPHPDNWCEECREAVLAKGGSVVDVVEADLRGETPGANRKRRAAEAAPAAAVAPTATRLPLPPALDEETVWQHYGTKLLDLAPPRTEVLWMGDYHYALCVPTHGRTHAWIDVWVARTTGIATFRHGTEGERFSSLEDALEAL